MTKSVKRKKRKKKIVTLSFNDIAKHRVIFIIIIKQKPLNQPAENVR